MPRSASKSRADRRVRKSSVQVASPPPEDQEVEYIIPGRLTQAMWMDMLVQEEAEDIVGEIMVELMGKVMEGCLKVYIERQVILKRHTCFLFWLGVCPNIIILTNAM